MVAFLGSLTYLDDTHIHLVVEFVVFLRMWIKTTDVEKYSSLHLHFVLTISKCVKKSQFNFCPRPLRALRATCSSSAVPVRLVWRFFLIDIFLFFAQ